MSMAGELEKAAQALTQAAEKLEGAADGFGGGHVPAGRFGAPGSMASGSGGAGVPGTSTFMGGFAGGKGFMAAAGPAGLAMMGAGMALDAANGAASFLTPAARGFAITGSSASLAAGVTKSAIDFLGSNPITNLLTAPLQVANETNQRAAGSTLGITEESDSTSPTSSEPSSST